MGEVPEIGVAEVRAMLDGGRALWLAPGAPPADLPGNVGAVVATSGSTGGPRHVLLGRDALRSAGLASRQALGRDLTWHLALPSHYVAGLLVLVRSAVVGRNAPVVGSDLAGLQPGGDGDAISLVPTQVHRALAEPGLRDRLAEMAVILVGGAALDPELWERTREVGWNVVTTYGMSETCGGVVWEGRPLPGVEVRTDGEDRIWLRGPSLFDGYLGEPAATAEALVDGWLRTADRGRLINGRLTLLGRLDDVVISGGVNIDLARVRDAVAALDPEAAVIAVADPEWGVRVVVFSADGGLTGWRERLAGALPRTWLPRQHVAVDPVPRTAGGKPDRARLEQLAHQSH